MAIIKICGILVDILRNILSTYNPYVTRYKKGVKQFLVRFQYALYGKMVASLLYYHNFTRSLTDIGFGVNPYNPFVPIKMVDRLHMSICFHVNDFKLIHHKRKTNYLVI